MRASTTSLSFSRHDHHDRLAGADDAANRVDAELIDGAVLRRPDLELCSWSWAAILRSASSLSFDSSSLSSLATSLRMSWSTWRICSSAWAISAPTWPALERSWPSWPSYCAAWRCDRAHAVGRDQLLVERRRPVELVLGEHHLALDESSWADDAHELLVELGDLLRAAGPAGPRGRRGGARMARSRARSTWRRGLVGARQQLWRKGQLVERRRAPPPGASCAAKISSMPLVMMARLAAAGGRIEADEKVARLDLVAVLDVDLGDRAAC